MIVTYRDYREKTPLGSFFNHSIIGYISSVLSPFVSIFCMRINIRPNTITLLMIVTGIIGGLVLMIPNNWCKLASSIIYVFWFTFDCSDGEVARFTKVFSKGGKYLDWCAHLITHSLFIISMWVSLIQFYDSYFILVTALSFIFVVAELLSRNTLSMNALYECAKSSSNSGLFIMSKKKFIYWQLVYMPNLLLIMPIVLFMDLIFRWNSMPYIYSIWGLLYSIAMFRVFFVFVYKMYKSE